MLYQLTLHWTDMYRIWSTAQIPIPYIEIPLKELWFPKFFSTGAGERKYISVVNIEKQIGRLYSGSVYLLAIDVIETKCSLDLWNFPFDTQTCQLLFQLERFFQGPNGMDIVLAKSAQAYRFDSYPDDEWELLDVSSVTQNISVKQYDYNADGTLNNQPQVMSNVATGFDVKVKLRRYYAYYIVNVIVPVIVLTLLDTVPLAMEDAEHEKLVTAISVVLGFMFVQGIVATLLPKSYITPNLSLYIVACICLSALSVMTEGFCYALCHRRGSPGKLVHFLIVRCLGVAIYPCEWLRLLKRWSFLRERRRRILDESTRVESLPAGLQKAEEFGQKGECSGVELDPPPESTCNWPRVAHVLNRLFALLHVAASIVLFLVFVVPIISFV